MSGHIFLLIGPSGAGKSTLINKVCKENPGIKYIASFTTRPMRPGDSQGNPYHFILEGKFEQLIADGEFFEYQRVHGNLYGTSKRAVLEILENGQIGITDIDIVGGLKIKHVCPNNITTIFIRPTDVKVLTERLVARNTETNEVLERRLERVAFELGLESECDIVVFNDVLEATSNELNRLIKGGT